MADQYEVCELQQLGTASRLSILCLPNLVAYAGFLSGGAGHLPPLGFGLPPLGYAQNSISHVHVNQFKPL